MGFTGRKYPLIENYFEKIDSQEKAYVLGFAASDGYNSGRGLHFRINPKDIEILEFIKSQISPTSKIHNYSNQADLSINSKRISEDLIKLGIIPNKSKTLKFPEIEEKYVRHFLRGCFDGDGSVSYRTYTDNRTKKGIAIRYVSASLEFIKVMEAVLRICCKLKYRNPYIHKKSGAYYLQYWGYNNVSKIFYFLYKDSCFHLDRKYEKFKKYYNTNGYL